MRPTGRRARVYIGISRARVYICISRAHNASTGLNTLLIIIIYCAI